MTVWDTAISMRTREINFITTAIEVNDLVLASFLANYTSRVCKPKARLFITFELDLTDWGK
jgi:hypothetical protein